MKVALMFGGLSRSADRCYPALYENLLARYDTDIYIHSYEETNISAYNSAVTEKQFTIEDLKNIYKPKKIVLEKYEDIKPEILNKIKNYNNINNTTIPERCLASFRKIQKCFELVEDSYDIYIRSRMDIYHETPIILENLDLTACNIPNETNKNTIFVDGYYHSYSRDFHGILDHFVIGDYQSIQNYCTLYSRLDDYCINKGLSLHAEYLTKINLELTNTKINRFFAEYSLHRKPY